MTITTRRIDTGYNDNVYTYLKKLEKLYWRVYSDSVGVPTLGVGYAMIVRREPNAINPDHFTLREDLINDLRGAGILGANQVLSRNDDRLLNDLLNNLNANPNDALPQNSPLVPGSLQNGDVWDNNDEELVGPAQDNNRFEFGLINADQARRLYDISMNRARDELRQRFSRKLDELRRDYPTIPADAATTLFSSLDNSYEMMALSSMAFHGVGSIGKLLTRALYFGDRAEAWYEIRYNTDTFYSRRFLEADTFGLYNDATNPSEADAKAAFRTLMRHRRELLGADGLLASSVQDDYDQVHAGDLTTAARWGRELQGQGLDIQVQSLSAILSIPWSRLTGTYVDSNPLIQSKPLIDGLILVGESDGTAGTEDTRWYKKFVPTAANDTIKGTGKNDLLVGESGSDVLYGLGGSDVIYGGAGNDTYRIEDKRTLSITCAKNKTAFAASRAGA